MIVINTLNEPFQSLSVDLDGTTYKITLQFNANSEEWYCSIADEEENVLFENVKIVENCNILSGKSSEFLPDGYLTAMNFTNTVGVDFFNDTNLVYIGTDETV